MKCKKCQFGNYSVMSSPCNTCVNHEDGKPSAFKKVFKDCCNCMYSKDSNSTNCDDCRDEVSRDDLFPGWQPAPNFDEDGKRVYYAKESI